MKQLCKSNYKIPLFLLLFLPINVQSQIYFSPDFTLNKEMKFRSGKLYKEEKYFKNNRLDSIYRKWDEKGRKITEGYYLEGKRNGYWTEWITEFSDYSYIKLSYTKGRLTNVYTFRGRDSLPASPKYDEHYYVLEPDKYNYSEHYINWNSRLGKGKKNEEKFKVIRNQMIVEKKIKRWDKGIPWEEEHTKALFDKKGKSLGHRKQGIWRLWNEDGTLQKETWYNMGKKLREKLYDHGKLISDKKY